MNKNKKIKPDDYYNDGLFEIARYRNVTNMKNNMNSAEIGTFKKTLADNYDTSKQEIDGLINEIIENVKIANPIGLMNYLVSMSFLSMTNKISEIEYSSEECYVIRAVEYIQCVLLAYGNEKYQLKEDQSELFGRILKLTCDLYEKLHIFYMSWTAKKQLEGNFSEEYTLEYIIEAQLSSFVRGDRYQDFQIPYLKALLFPQEDIIFKAYGLSARELIKGLEKLEYSLSSGKADAINELRYISEEYEEQFINEEYEKIPPKGKELVNRVLGMELYDVEKVTSWDKRLIDSLSIEIGKDKSLFTHQEFSGWPIWDLPISKKPFLKIKGISYCFSYYSLFDNIYRSLQKTILNRYPIYIDEWAKNQQNGSEQLVENLFKKILPECHCYRNNYYPKSKSLKHCFENDIIITYRDMLIIVEVKAGSFTYTPAIVDYQAHMKSFKDLVEKANNQCERMLQYINNNSEAVVYDAEKNKKTVLRKDDFTQVFSFCVNVDDFNVFTAKAEKINFINITNGTIAISIDDLWVYAEYFDSPVEFVHFLRQRKRATNVKQLRLNDELDHLGLYLEHNMYTLQYEGLENDCIATVEGYREQLDNYFGKKHIGVHIDKPSQNIPELMQKVIFKAIAEPNNKYPLRFTNFLLDFSESARQEFQTYITKLLDRQNEIGRSLPVITFGDIRYCLFADVPNVKHWNIQKRVDYTYAAILQNDVENYYLINLTFKNNELLGVDYQFIEKKDIPVERMDELKEQANQNKVRLVANHMKKTGKKKIGRNEKCPCGSGKKYKHCCGK